MIHIKNRSDLKMAYEILMDMQALRPYQEEKRQYGSISGN